MDDFETLKNSWKEQRVPRPSNADFSALKNSINTLSSRQKMTNIILLVTAAVLVAFFFYIKAFEYRHVALAIISMILVLLIRVLVEILSIKRLKQLTTTETISNFKKTLERYYKNRIWVHLLLTPILLVVYAYSFWTLFPDFKTSLSEGFYTYIVYSSIVILVSLLVLIGRDVRKEFLQLRELKEHG